MLKIYHPNEMQDILFSFDARFSITGTLDVLAMVMLAAAASSSLPHSYKFYLPKIPVIRFLDLLS